MNPGTLLDAAGARALEFEWLSEAVRPAGEYGLRIFDNLRPFVPGEEGAAQARARRIGECAAALDGERLDALRETMRATPDAMGAIARASMGEVLADAALFELQRFCDAAARVDELASESPAIAPVFNAGVRCVHDALEPGRTGAFEFYLADAFDPGLAAARAEFARAQADFDAARGREIAAIAARLGRDDLSADEFIVMRDDLKGELPPGVRVVREAPTYILCAVEFDATTLAALERQSAAAGAVAAAEERVRSALSALVAANGAQLDAATVAFGELDVLVAAARFAQRYDCAVAEIVAPPSLAFEGGRFLPMETELAREGRHFAPIDIDLHDVAVLTGPNMGGKSVCLRTCGLVALCAALGLPVPARRAKTSLFDEIAWLGMGAGEEDFGGLLSSFAREVVRLRGVLSRDVRGLLVLADEFARTTTPVEGKALTVALLERLRARGACGLAATHFSGVAAEAGTRHFAVRGLRGIPAAAPAGDLHEALAALAASMDYTIAEAGEGTQTGADAIALAALLGLDPELVALARRHLSDSSES